MSSIYEDYDAMRERRNRTNGRNDFGAATAAQRERATRLVLPAGQGNAEVERMRREYAFHAHARRILIRAALVAVGAALVAGTVWALVLLTGN